MTGCPLCAIHGPGHDGACAPYQPDPVADVSVLAGDWQHDLGTIGGKERRTLTGDEALDLLDRIVIASERIEIEHRWTA
jgi:hypothetical protein